MYYEKLPEACDFSNVKLYVKNFSVNFGNIMFNKSKKNQKF